MIKPPFLCDKNRTFVRESVQEKEITWNRVRAKEKIKNEKDCL